MNNLYFRVMIEIRDLTKVYGRTQTPAVKGLNLEISDGEILGSLSMPERIILTALTCNR